MSMSICLKCGNFIDTDDDPDSTYFEKGCVCETCRENLTINEETEHWRLLNK